MILRNLEILGVSGTRDIVVEGDTIREVLNGGSANGTALSFESAIAFPGLVNSHDHLEFDVYEQLEGGPYRDYIEWAEDIWRRHAGRIAAVESMPREFRIRAGILRNLLCGVTSVAHHGHHDCGPAPISIIGGTRCIHSPRLEGVRGLLSPDRRPVVVHVGEGVGSEAEREIDTFLRWNLWRKKLLGVHAIAMRTDQASRFAAIIWCPISNEFLYGQTAPISELKRHAVILLGTDSTLTGPWNVWTHLRRARELAYLTDQELIAGVTQNAGLVWNLRHRGRIQSGAVADIVIARKRREDTVDAFFATNPEDILLVIRDGSFVLIDESLRGSLPSDRELFPVVVNGSRKLTTQDYGDVTLPASLHVRAEA
jgi:cytosine/adenosine deaminase-related metal-dependent hydrolase